MDDQTPTANPKTPHETELTYVRDAGGRFYLQIPLETGGHRYEPAESGLDFEPIGNNRWLAVRSRPEARRQRDPLSSTDYFEALKRDEAHAKQNLARQKRMERQLNNITLTRVTPHAGPRVEFITDERMEEYQALYRSAFASGQQAQCPFQPLSTYAHKLQLPDGSWVRPLFQGEVGLLVHDERRSTVVVLQQGYGTGNFVQVAAKVGGT